MAATLLLASATALLALAAAWLWDYVAAMPAHGLIASHAGWVGPGGRG